MEDQINNLLKRDKKINLFKKCNLCGGWGKDLVKENGYCDHCNRINNNKGIKRKGLEMENNNKIAKIEYFKVIYLVMMKIIMKMNN